MALFIHRILLFLFLAELLHRISRSLKENEWSTIQIFNSGSNYEPPARRRAAS